VTKTAWVLISAYFAASAAASGNDYIVSTIAGGIAPTMPVAARKAFIGAISGMAIDSAGNIYLSTDLSCVFRMNPAGIVTRFAGTCRPGYSGDGGPATSAQLNFPSGMAADATGALYIADRSNHVIRKVLPDGTITTIAGNGQMAVSGDGGPATKAGLPYPTSIAIDAAGNVFIAESNSIRRVARDGTITNLVGNAAPGIAIDGRTPIESQVVFPICLALDREGNLLFSTFSNEVRRLSPSGTIATVAGTAKSGDTGDGGPATSAQLSSPSSIAVDRAGNLYIACYGQLRLRKVSAGGTITTIAGVGDQGLPGKIFLLLAIDSRGATYAAESRQKGNGWRLRKISPSGAISTVAGSDLGIFTDGKTAIHSGLYYPTNLALDSADSLYIAEGSNLGDIYHDRIRKVLGSGRIVTVAGGVGSHRVGDGGPAIRAAISNYCSLAVDAQGNLYISQRESHRVRKVSAKGIISTIAGTGSPGFGGDGGPAVRAQLNYPGGIALDSAGNLYIADPGNRRVRRVAIDGSISTVAGNGNRGPSGNGGLAVNAALGGPGEVAVDSVGSIYILEREWGQVRKVSASGIISSVASVPNTRSIAVDRSDTLYFETTSSIVKLSAEGVAETIAGSFQSGYSGDGGPASEARFANLNGIAIDRAGRIYVSDVIAHAVRMLTPVQAPKVDTSDLKVELRSATGSNQFQIGEEIPLQMVLCSSKPNRYLQPCGIFSENDFSTPQCRFFNHWSFSIKPDKGWGDLSQEFPSGVMVGSHYSAVSRNLRGMSVLLGYSGWAGLAM
jgi:sugar lactone lactonase YvrE